MRLSTIIKRAVAHELISGSFFIFLGSFLGGFLAFLLNLFLARSLTYADYGIIMTLISFAGLMTVPSQSVTTTIVQFATNLYSKKQYGGLFFIYKKSLQVMLVVGIGVFVVFFLAQRLLGTFLHIQNSMYIVLTGLFVSLVYVGLVNNAMLQSLLKFGFYSFTSFLGNITKVIFGVLFVAIGFKVFGVLFALILMGVIPLLVSFYPLRFLFREKEIAVPLSKKHVAGYAVLVTIATLALSSFISTDIILVKHFFTPSQAGLYAGLTLTGKAIFYLTGPISTVLFPVIIRRYSQGKDFSKTFFLALGLVGAPSLLITFFYYLFPEFTIHFFLGGRGFLALSNLAWMYGLFLTEFSLLNICITFFLSLKQMTFIFPLVVAALCQIIGILFFHKDFTQVIMSSLVSASILLTVLLLYYLKLYGTKTQEKK